MQIWPMITLHYCMYADQDKSGKYECGLGHRACERQEWMSREGFRNSGVCVYYRESHPVNNDGTLIQPEEGGDER